MLTFLSTASNVDLSDVRIILSREGGTYFCAVRSKGLGSHEADTRAASSHYAHIVLD